jgi:DNA (cytosine-5)-methyltransferase 1
VRNVLSLFSGVGCGDLAFNRRGVPTVLMAEADPNARGVLRHHHPDVPILEDVRDVTGDVARSVGFAGPDGGAVLAGWPCQDLSVAGKRAGMVEGSGTRSALWWEVVRILDETQSEWFVGENVPGLLSSRGGRDMGAVVGSLARLGYGFGYRVLDAQHFGVPQRRRRVFFVARRACDGRSAAQVLLEREGLRGDPAPRVEAGAQPSRAAGEGAAGGGGIEVARLLAFGHYAMDDVSSTVQSRDWKYCTDLVVGAAPAAVCENCGNEEGSIHMHLCLPCAERL